MLRIEAEQASNLRCLRNDGDMRFGVVGALCTVSIPELGLDRLAIQSTSSRNVAQGMRGRNAVGRG
jgi:hypothetical protein